MKVAGRSEEIILLQNLIEKEASSFAAIYGRRRIGKTYLIRQVYEKHIFFECSGLHEKEISQQLENFWLMLQEHAPTQPYKVLPPKTWLQAFKQLKNIIQTQKETKKKVIFLDEISWFETPRSGFLAALDNFWNQFCSKRSDIILIICGSAASWIIDKVINNRGGLHNRITEKIQLLPFTITETMQYLAMLKVKLSIKDIVQLYMSVGGVPFYLKDLKPGISVPQIINQLYFNKNAVLKNEFQNLYASLFKNNELHEKIVAALAKKNKGLTRNELIQVTGLSSGGALSKIIEELLQCGFIQQINAINKKKDDALYRLIDEYTFFYFKFLKQKDANANWLTIFTKPSYKIWSGFAFENFCFKHIQLIKKALGINGIISNENSWIHKGNAGAQIDMLIDRDDNCITILEIKYYDTEFEITKKYAAELQNKLQQFKVNTKTNKNIFVTMLSIYGAKKNEHFLENITNQIILKDLI